jgi:hypothetical protein
MPVKPPNFNKPKQAPPPAIVPRPVAAPAGATLQLDPNGPPLPKRQVFLPESTKVELRKIGWQEGDPLPGDFNLRLQEIFAEQARERESAKHPLPDDWEPPKLKTVNLSELSPERQAELQETLRDYKKEMAAEAARQAAAAEIAKDNAGVSPSVQQARQIAAEAAQPPAVTGKNFTFVDDRPLPEGKKLGGVSGISPTFAKIEQLKQERAPQQPPQHTHEPPATAGVAIPHQNCPRCKWDLARPFDVVVTDQDKIAFRAALLHPQSKGRFRKEYTILPGLTVRFRGMTLQEKDWLRKQMKREVRAGNIVSEAEFYAEMMAFRLACSTERIDFDGDANDIPEVASIPRAEDADSAQTPLADMRQWFETEVAPTESLMALLATEHAEFQRLVEALETQGTDPNFWQGIAPGR